SPRGRRLRAFFIVVTLPKSQARACAPYVAAVFPSEPGKFPVSVGRGVVQSASETRKLALRGFIFGRSGSNFRRGSIRCATRSAGDRLRLVRFFLLRVNRL